MSVKHPGPFQLPPLPWDEGALAPAISARTIALHYGGHHAAYVKKLNELVASTRFAEMPLQYLIADTVGNKESQAIFNNAAQAWNHAFYWKSLAPRSGGEPPRSIGKRLEDDFGGYSGFREKFRQAAIDCFGSGWCWLVERDGKLQILATPNAATPITLGATPLLAIDVWEHAYYVDYENRRTEYVDAVIAWLLNWRFAEEQLAKGHAALRHAA